MSEIPTWWLVLSGIVFVFNILWFAALSFAVIKLVGVLGKLQPEVKTLSDRVKTLIERVENVAQRVEDLAEHLKETVVDVGAKTKGVAGSVELVAQSASKQFERFSPFIVGAMSAIRLIKALNEMRHGKPAAAATTRRAQEKTPAHVNHKKKGLIGLLRG